EYLFKNEEREKYMDYSYRLGKFLEAQDISDGKILLAGTNRIFYLPDNTIRQAPFINFTRYDIRDDKIEFLKEQGITYVLLKVSEDKDDQSTGFDPVSFFKSKIGKRLEVVAQFKDEYDFILCKIND
ncbi:MAG: hypothetical protein ACE5JK_05840, partial [Candidatus Omnitrophota bacterium]